VSWETGLDVLGVLVSLFALAYLLELRASLASRVEELHEHIEILEEITGTVATVLSRLPELMPTFELQNNPLSQLLEFFKGVQQTTNEDAQLRDVTTGRFDGDSSSEEGGSEGPPGA
jgi:hypothetical protein